MSAKKKQKSKIKKDNPKKDPLSSWKSMLYFFSKTEVIIALISALVLGGFKAGSYYMFVKKEREISELDNKFSIQIIELNNKHSFEILEQKEKYINEVMELKHMIQLKKIKYEKEIRK